MMQLPDEFIRITRELMGEQRFERFLSAFNEEAPVSIRLNPLKLATPVEATQSDRVPWCGSGYYLPSRPNFTFDPLLHAGCYYVQEAASMFVGEVLRQHLPSHPVMMLDLCAAPGGKSTLARTVLPQGSVLFSNEPVRNRASILSENIQKWGYPDCVVTNNYPADYRKSGLQFNVILCDVPCSGEGMFRKDPATISEWSMQHVEHCWQLQRQIVADAWQCLLPGGLLIYSTCTYNIKENEENVRWMRDELGADILPVDIYPEWHITSSLLPDFSAPVYRFIPGISRSEGLFVAVMRKRGLSKNVQTQKSITKALQHLKVIPPLSHTKQGGDGAAETVVPLDYPTAIAFLRHEAIVLPVETPRGIVGVSFFGHRLGFVKNIGSRANNLYPKEWAIKSTYIPDCYNPVVASLCELAEQC